MVKFLRRQRHNLRWPSRRMIEVEFGDFTHEPHGDLEDPDPDPDPDPDQHGPNRVTAKA